MTDSKRLIEVAFPLEATSLDSVHEKNVRHGHISTLHIWPARRPLAACRATLITTLLPDPSDADERAAILRRLAGRVEDVIERKKIGGKVYEKKKRETKGGILHWGRESGPDLEWFRAKIRETYGGRAPRVLDPFAGGGAIPLEAMRLGCEVTAIDINPVAWFILKCTLDYPQRLAGETRPLPDFALRDRDFMKSFLKAKGYKGAGLRTTLERLGLGDGGAIQLDALPHDDPTLEADLGWHVRAWGCWVLARGRCVLADLYPVYADFQPRKEGKEFRPQPTRRVPRDAEGVADIGALTGDYDDAYLKDPRNPRWVVKPTVAYLWARTVRCKGCRATFPLLKTRWLCRKDNKRVVLTMAPSVDRTGVAFGVQTNVPVSGGNAAQRREIDKRLGAGTMSRSGAQCPCCPTIMIMEDLRHEGRGGRLGAVMTAVVVDGPKGKEYRRPTEEELAVADVPMERLTEFYADLPFGIPTEPIPLGASRAGGGSPFTTPLYGLDTWAKLFTQRQLCLLGCFVHEIRSLIHEISNDGYAALWAEAIQAVLACAVDRLADRASILTTWQNNAEKLGHTFARFALPISWDYAESSPLVDTTGGFVQAVEWVAQVVDHTIAACGAAPAPTVAALSAIAANVGDFDAIVTDPPYYDAIPYSDLMDFFHVWLRRALGASNGPFDAAFAAPLGPKWNAEANDGELVDDASRFGGDNSRSKANYEDGMARAFARCHAALTPNGRLVVVFANKNPAAWETLVAALIRAGFVVVGSWPIQTERQSRTRAMASAALSSSVWLVCRKRPAGVRPGWDNQVLAEMRGNIARRLRAFWDAGIRGPDFVWAATGPALEAFSRHPVVKKAAAQSELMTVSDFLREARRMVVDFVVGRVLTHGEGSEEEEASGLDDVTTYYLLHRHTFGLVEAPIGAAILYAMSCNLSDAALIDRHDLLARKGAELALVPDADEREIDEEGSEADEGGGSGEHVRLKGWNERHGRLLGLEGPGGTTAPLIDQIHKLVRMWKSGEEVKVNEYLDAKALARNEMFRRVLQAVLELGERGSDERTALEAISNHIAARAGLMPARQSRLV